MNDYSELINELKTAMEYPHSITIFRRAAYALESLTAENEREKNGNEVLRAERDELHRNNCKLRDTNKALESDNYNLNMNLEHITDDLEKLREDNARHTECLNLLTAPIE